MTMLCLEIQSVHLTVDLALLASLSGTVWLTSGSFIAAHSITRHHLTS